MQINIPESIDHEKAILSRCINFPEDMSEAVEYLKSHHFNNKSHSEIFSSLTTLFKKEQPTDYITLIEYLKSNNKLDKIGGAFYVTELLDTPIAVNLEQYCNIIKNKFIAKKLLFKCNEIIQKCNSENGEDLLNYAQSEILKIDTDLKPLDIYRLSDLIHDFIEDLETPTPNGIPGIKTGFTLLDKATLGLQRSNLVILAGRPGMGKSAMASDLGKNIAESGVPVLEFHLEMSKKESLQRKYSNSSGIELKRIRSKEIRPNEWGVVKKTSDNLYMLNSYINESSDMTVENLRNKTRKMVRDHNIGVIIIDYIQLFKTPKTERRDLEVGEITRSLKMMAKELNIVVIALSQLNRNSEGRDNKRPRLSDLRESGAIEQDADLVLFLYRPEYYMDSYRDSNDEKKQEAYRKVKGLAELHIAKHRNGETGMIRLTWLEKITSFRNHGYEVE